MNRVTILTMETSCIGDQACHNDDDDDGDDDDGGDGDGDDGDCLEGRRLARLATD